MAAAETVGNGVQIVNLVKIFGGMRAIDGIDLTIAPGEFVALLGPSGCGKTTLLRAIAGLLAPDEGLIRLGDATVADARGKLFVPAEKRNLGMVFQDYALWPHMRVRDNVAFPLAARGCPVEQRSRLIETALRRVSLWHLAERFPGELSGGQQQRVALARAIVDSPRVLLFDEPLSNLDAGLRDTLGRDIAILTRELGATAIYVTHDQSEALSLADRIAVMRGGSIIQADAPEQLYKNPADAWVAGFLKSGSLIRGQTRDGSFHPEGSGAPLHMPDLIDGHTGPSTLMLPSTAVQPRGEGELSFSVASVHFKGDRYEVAARWGAHDHGPVVQFWHDRPLRPGDTVTVNVDRAPLRLFLGEGPTEIPH
ncbi:MAG TPA: ABC transporter ATP-binding protein [Alphaproteobacteria bacterium]